jgi:hypothetical protein
MAPPLLATALCGSSPEVGVWPLRSSVFNGVSAYGTAAMREDRFTYLRAAAGDAGSWQPGGGSAKT